ncbi:MAG TPA: mannose-1-phosphate guanylyltransferase [Magnetospirillaceae bacterium]|nr:mannose-1-phosphate guanylyltransferase [Magnetospirillaceae bacterium]
MIVVIIAGGSGTRLWPLSTPDYPKHLLKLEGDESLLQNAYRRAKSVAETVYVITEVSHADHVRKQLPTLTHQTLIIEPARRGTANCVLAGLHRVEQYHSHDEPIAFIAADHFVRDVDGFAQSFRIAAKATQGYKRICLVGVEPTYPSTGFGYIQKADLVADEDMVYNVARFKEKPALDAAQEYVKSGHYLWNCSYFVGSHDTFEATIDEHSPFMKDNYEQLNKAKDVDDFNKIYLSLKTDTIDFALSDHVDNFLVVPATFDWMDVGSFQDLYMTRENDADKDGNAVQGGHVMLDGVQNSLVRNDEEKPLAVIGLDNVVVVNTPNGIVVARKDLAPRVGDIAKKLQGKTEKPTTLE